MVKIALYLISASLLYGLGVYCRPDVEPVVQTDLQLPVRVEKRSAREVKVEKEKALVTGAGRKWLEREKDAVKLAKPWVLALHSLDKDAMAAALAEIKEALLSDDRHRQLMALSAFGSAHTVFFDRAQFRPYAERLLDSPDPVIREKAFWILYASGVQDGDVEKVRELVHDPDMHGALPQLLVYFEKRQLSPESSSLLNQLLHTTKNRKVQISIIDSVGHTSCSSELIDSIIALSRNGDEDLSYTIIDHALSRVRLKSPAVVERLVESLSIPREAFSAASGLQYVKDPRIAPAILKVLAEARVGYHGDRIMNLVQKATAKDLPLIEKGLANPSLGEKAKNILKNLHTRLSTP